MALVNVRLTCQCEIMVNFGKHGLLAILDPQEVIVVYTELVIYAYRSGNFANLK